MWKEKNVQAQKKRKVKDNHQYEHVNGIVHLVKYTLKINKL